MLRLIFADMNTDIKSSTFDEVSTTLISSFNGEPDKRIKSVFIQIPNESHFGAPSTKQQDMVQEIVGLPGQ